MIVGGITVRGCNGAGTLGCAVLAEVLKSNARDLVNVKFSAEKVSVLLVVENSEGVILTVEVFENEAGSGLVVPRGTLKVSGVVSEVAAVVYASIEGRGLILVSNLVEVLEMSMVGVTEEFVLLDSDGVTLTFGVVVLLWVKTVVLGTVMVPALEASN